MCMCVRGGGRGPTVHHSASVYVCVCVGGGEFGEGQLGIKRGSGCSDILL